MSDQDQPSSFKDRGAERTPVLTTTQLRAQNLYSVEVKIRDVSTRGFMAECDDSVRIGSYVSLKHLANGRVVPCMRRCAGSWAGGWAAGSSIRSASTNANGRRSGPNRRTRLSVPERCRKAAMWRAGRNC